MPDHLAVWVVLVEHHILKYLSRISTIEALWPSGLRRRVQEMIRFFNIAVRKGVGSNPTGVISFCRP